MKPTSGSASIFGLDCSQEPARIAKDVGYLPSENCYYNNMKVREMLLYTAELYGVDGHRRMEELAGRFNLDLSRRIGDLSLGNKKKVGRDPIQYANLNTSYWQSHFYAYGRLP